MPAAEKTRHGSPIWRAVALSLRPGRVLLVVLVLAIVLAQVTGRVAGEAQDGGSSKQEDGAPQPQRWLSRRRLSQRQAATSAANQMMAETPSSALLSKLAGGASAAAAASTSSGGTAAASAVGDAAATAFQPSPQLKFLQGVLRNRGADPDEALASMVEGDGFKALLRHPEMQHRLLERFPTLEAFPAFKPAMGRRLSHEETATQFARGVRELLAFTKDARTKIKDPNVVLDIVGRLAKSDDPEVQALLDGVAAGQEGALLQLQDKVAAEYFPGLDLATFRAKASEQGRTLRDLMLNEPGIMRFIDKDPHVSRAIRGGGLSSSRAATVADQDDALAQPAQQQQEGDASEAGLGRRRRWLQQRQDGA